jgi:hypothetical protein
VRRKQHDIISSLILFTVLASFLMTSCASRSIRIGWLEHDASNRKQASYRKFTGKERATIRASAGETLHLSWDVTVEKGSLTFRLLDPQKDSLWVESYLEDTQGSVTLPLPQKGIYTLWIQGGETRGSFDLTWVAEAP